MTVRFSDQLAPGERAQMLDAFEAAAEQVGLGVFVVEIEPGPPRITYISAVASALLGRDPEEIVGQAPWDIMVAEDGARMRAMIERPERTAPATVVTFHVRNADGGVVPAEVGLTRFATDEHVFTVGYFRDVRDRTDAVAALRRSEARFRLLVEAAPDGVVMLRGPRITFLNTKAAELLGVPSPAHAIGREITSFLVDEDAARAGERIRAMLVSGVEYAPSIYVVKGAPEPRDIEIKSIMIEQDGERVVLAFARDVTERQAMQRDLLRADRLAAVGALSAAVAHEINNPLTYAQLSLQMIERELGLASTDPTRLGSMREHLRNARHGVERVATIVRDLRNFARPDEAPPGPVDVVAAVEQAIKIADHDLRHRGRLIRQYEEVPRVIGNASRLEQVFLNLLVNAIQSLRGDAARDAITIEIRAHGPDQVRVVVRDTGSGIPAAARDRVFDPFFTTKPLGEGTGLGLSVCRGIVAAVGGSIELESTEGVGTTVTVLLRVHDPAVASAPTPPTPARASRPTAAPGRRLRVLVVDDEPLVRRVLVMILSPHHDVEVVATGADALDWLDRERADVVICDLMMPEMNGMDLYARLRERHPGLERRVVFITGGAFVPRMAAFLDATDNLKLLKPFEIQQVLSAVIAAAER